MDALSARSVSPDVKDALRAAATQAGMEHRRRAYGSNEDDDNGDGDDDTRDATTAIEADVDAGVLVETEGINGVGGGPSGRRQLFSPPLNGHNRLRRQQSRSSPDRAFTGPRGKAAGSMLMSPDAARLKAQMVERELAATLSMREVEVAELKRSLTGLKDDFETNLILLTERDEELSKQDEELQLLNASYRQLFDDAVRETNAIERERAEHERSMQSRLEEREAEMEDLRRAHSLEVDQLRAEHARALAGMEMEYAGNIRSLEEQLSRSAESMLQQRDAEHTSEMMRMMTAQQKAEAMLGDQRRLEDALRDAEDERARMVLASEDAASRLQAAQNECVELRERLRKREERAKELEGLLSKAAREKGGLLAEAEAKLMEAQAEADSRKEAESARIAAEGVANELRADLASAMIETEAAQRECRALQEEQQHLRRSTRCAEDTSVSVASECEELIDACRHAMEGVRGRAEEEIRSGCAQVQTMRSVVADLKAELDLCKTSFSKDLDAVVRAVLESHQRGARTRSRGMTSPAEDGGSSAVAAMLASSTVADPILMPAHDVRGDMRPSVSARIGDGRRHVRFLSRPNSRLLSPDGARARVRARQKRGGRDIEAVEFDSDFAALAAKYCVRRHALQTPNRS